MNIKKILTTILAVAAFSVCAFGADRALVVGIDQYKTVSDTPGSVADAEAMANFIQRKYKFPKQSIHILRESQATAAEIKREIQEWLIKGTQPGDRVFFFYSGHGGQVDDDNGDEKDELDEVLAPYDVDPGSEKTAPTNVIRDDDMNLFLLQLAGRRVVMAFDSCHSGTLSRNIEPKSKFVTLKNKRTPFATSRSISDQESYVPKEAGKKDMSLVKEDIIDGRLNNVVIFSATSPGQKAMWLKDQSRGAFAYSFEKVQENNESLTVSELARRIKDYVEHLKREKLALTSQVPEVEIIPENTLKNKPLFGENPNLTGTTSNWEASVLPALNNPLADFQVEINLSATAFKVGDKINYSVRIQGLKPSEKAFLYIFVYSLDADGKKHVTSLFPTSAGNDFDNKIENGIHRFPRQGRDGNPYETEALTPGKDIFVALVTKSSISFGDKDEYTWEEANKLIGINKLQGQINEQVEKITRSVGNRPKLDGGAWQASSVVVRVE